MIEMKFNFFWQNFGSKNLTESSNKSVLVNTLMKAKSKNKFILAKRFKNGHDLLIEENFFNKVRSMEKMRNIGGKRKTPNRMAKLMLSDDVNTSPEDASPNSAFTRENIPKIKDPPPMPICNDLKQYVCDTGGDHMLSRKEDNQYQAYPEELVDFSGENSDVDLFTCNSFGDPDDFQISQNDSGWLFFNEGDEQMNLWL